MVPSRFLNTTSGGKVLNSNDNDIMRNVICGHGNVDVVSDDQEISDHEEYKLSHPIRMLASNLYSMQGDCGSESAVYVIADIFGKYVKIGEAKDINKRLLQLQAGNPLRLYVHRAFLFRNKQYAQYVEIEAHHLAERRGYKRMQSEWFKCSPSQAHDIIISTADSLRISAFGVVTPGKEHWGCAA